MIVVTCMIREHDEDQEKVDSNDTETNVSSSLWGMANGHYNVIAFFILNFVFIAIMLSCSGRLPWRIAAYACKTPRQCLSTTRSRHATGNTGCSEEVEAAKAAAKSTKPSSTIFSKIIDREIPADIVHEDDSVRI